MNENQQNRRDVSTRKITLFHQLAKSLVKAGVTPNQVSVASSVFAALSGYSFFLASTDEIHIKFLMILAILGIQLRLICNLIDGLMAVEGGLKTKSGELFNDVPDRVSDVFILLGAGFYSGHINLGWLAGVLAVATAYVRTLGASMTGTHDFAGPMAKQHRMFLVTLGAFGGLLTGPIGTNVVTTLMASILWLIVLGCLLTCWNRLRRIYKKLEG